MGFFGKLVNTVVNVATLPVSVVADAVTLGGVATDSPSYTLKHLNMIKKEANEE